MGRIKLDESNGVTCDWCFADACFMCSLENTDSNEFRRVFSQYSQQIFSVAPKINQRPLPYAFLHFCSHAHLFVYLYIVPVVEVIFELNRLIYNKINYIRQHYFLLIHKATCFDPSVGHLQIYIAD